jgi:hypothetical protein
MTTFFCTFSNDACFTDAAGVNVPIRDRIRQVTNDVLGAELKDDHASGPDRVMQVRCTSDEAALTMKLTFINLPVVFVADRPVRTQVVN